MDKLTNNLFNIIKSEASSISDKDGETVLLRYAKNVSEDNDKTKLAIEEINSLKIEKLTPIEISAFLSFLHYAKIPISKIQGILLNYIRKKEVTHDEILKRGLLIRFLSEKSEDSISLSMLMDNNLLRKNEPWLWIDSMVKINFEMAAIEITDQIKKNSDMSIKNLLIRIPVWEHFVSRDSLTLAIGKWHAGASKEFRHKFNKWIERYGIIEGLSLEVRYKIDTEVFFQQERVTNLIDL